MLNPVYTYMHIYIYIYIYICVCVCERERERVSDLFPHSVDNILKSDLILYIVKWLQIYIYNSHNSTLMFIHS